MVKLLSSFPHTCSQAYTDFNTTIARAINAAMEGDDEGDDEGGYKSPTTQPMMTLRGMLA